MVKSLPSLPLPPTRLIGRDRELAEWGDLLLGSQVRLLTLTGVGGGGKTRLALALAAQVAAMFDDHVYWAGLASTTSDLLLPREIAAAIGVIETPGTPLVDSITDRLAPTVCLLVLDNCEHLLDACADIVEHLLSRCPDLRVLVTSREPLQIPGEHQRRVPPLAVPRPAGLGTGDDVAHSPAVRLFLERAQAVVPEFSLAPTNAGAVAEICIGLAGIPLALELAAARVHVLTVQQILSRLDEALRLLSGGSRTAPARQQTLQATLDWSYNLLTEAEQSCFRRLATFAGGFDLEAAEAICSASLPNQPRSVSDVLDLISRLIDKSLVVANSQSSPARYHLLEPIRQYARARLIVADELEAVRAGHTAWYLARAQQAARELRGPAQVAWLARVALDQDNLRAALRWAVESGHVETAARLSIALVPFWEVQGNMSEGRQWLAAVLESGPPSAIPLRLRSMLLLAAGRLAFWQVDLAQATALLDESLSLARAADDGHVVAEALTWLGFVSSRQRDFSAAVSRMEESLALHRMLDDDRGIALATYALGSVAANQARYEHGLPLFEESLEQFTALQDLRFSAIASLELGGLLVDITGGDLNRAGRLLRDGLRGLLAVGDRAFLISGLVTLAKAEAKLGRRPRAARLIGATAALRDALGAQLSPLQREREALVITMIRPRLGEAALAAALAEGRTMTVEQAIAETLSDDQAVPSSRKASPLGGPVEILTPREREVALLLAQGATDREIASRLVIAAGTASVHVHRILSKLELNSRWQVADWAVAQGFVLGPSD